MKPYTHGMCVFSPLTVNSLHKWQKYYRAKSEGAKDCRQAFTAGLNACEHIQHRHPDENNKHGMA